jgi:hypothetical protein
MRRMRSPGWMSSRSSGICSMTRSGITGGKGCGWIGGFSLDRKVTDGPE